MGMAQSHTNVQGSDSSKGSSQRIRLPHKPSNSKHLSRSSSAVLKRVSSVNNSQMEISSSCDSDTLNTTPSSTSEKVTADQCQDIDVDMNEEEKVGHSTVQKNSMRRSKEKYSDNLFQAEVREVCNHYLHDFERSTNQPPNNPQNHREPTIKQRSQSPALPCMPPKKRSEYDSHVPEDDENSIAHAEIMYTQATWRMYNRIMSARTKKAQLRALRESIENQTINCSVRRVPLSQNITSFEHQMMFGSESDNLMNQSNQQEMSEPSSSYNDKNKNCRSDSFDHAPILFSLEMES